MSLDTEKFTPEEEEELWQRYCRALHAMQSGVATKLGLGMHSDVGPKHLRVGINAAMSDHGALVGLLVDLGIITRRDYLAKIVEYMEREQQSFERELSEAFGKPVKLG